MASLRHTSLIASDSPSQKWGSRSQSGCDCITRWCPRKSLLVRQFDRIEWGHGVDLGWNGHRWICSIEHGLGFGFIYRRWLCHTSPNLSLLPIDLTMGRNKHKILTPLDTTSIHGPATKGQGSAIVELGDMGDHIDKLKQVSDATQQLADLLVGQLRGLSGTVPVLRGFEIVCFFGSILSSWLDLSGAIDERIEGALERVS